MFICLVAVAKWPGHRESDCVLVAILSHGTSQKATKATREILQLERDLVVQLKCDILKKIMSNPKNWKQLFNANYEYWKKIISINSDQKDDYTMGMTAQHLRSKAIKHFAMRLVWWAEMHIITAQAKGKSLNWEEMLCEAENERDSLDRIIESKPSTGSSLVYGTDGVTLTVDQIVSPFKDCEGLRGKPKLFFIQVSYGSSLSYHPFPIMHCFT